MYEFYWSLDQLVVETLGVTSVRSYVLSFVRPSRFLGNRSLLFSETLQLVRACRCEKNVPRALLIIFTILAILAKNCPTWPFLAKNDQNRGFWHFSRTAHQNFLIFCVKHNLWRRKIITFSLFGGNFKNGPVWPKLTQI